jgi:preprotein translocase subunit SecD
MTDLDLVARTAVERARQEAGSVDVPRANDVTTRRATAQRRRRVTGVALATLIVAGGVFAVAATRNGDHKQPAITVEPTTVPAGVRHPTATLEFRAVLATTPRAGCKLTAEHPASNSWLRDRDQTACYLVGPVILGGEGIEWARPDLNPTTSEWELNVHFANDDFVTKVATPYVGRQIAIVVDGVVQSAPTVNQGITSRDVTISGNFTRVEAENLARRLAP